MSSTAFSSSDDVILRKINCTSEVTHDEDLLDLYELNQCTEWISTHSCTNVALQFPDELLVDAPKVASFIQEALPNTCVFVLGDTSYGSCCVDEVGAQHYKADCIIHFGHACLSPTTRLPLLYVFGKSAYDTKDCLSKIKDSYPEKSRKTILCYDTSYTYIIGELFKQLQKLLPQLILSKLYISKNACMNNFLDCDSESMTESECTDCDENSLAPSNTQFIQKCGRKICLPNSDDVNDYSMIFLGCSNSPTLISLMMTFNKCPFFVYDPKEQTIEPTNVNINKALMKRYYLVERAKDAGIVGIVVGTLGVERYKEIIDHLKVLIKKVGKKSYTFVIGKLNPAKLANFAEVDIYVLVSCLESSLLEQKDFYRPVVTPFEMELACNKAREWDGEYTTEFASLLPGSFMHIEAPKDSEYTGEGDVSLISNCIRVLGQKETPELCEKDVKDVVLRSDATTVANVAEDAGEFFSMRSWKGLEKKLGETPVLKASEGRTGIAASYENENAQSNEK